MIPHIHVRSDTLLLVNLLLSLCHLCLCQDLTYHVEEEKGPGTYLGDLAADSHLLKSVLPQEHSLIKYGQLPQGSNGVSQLFHVHEKTGKLYTAQTLDAEALCIYNVECFRMVDVAVKKANSFIWILKVKVIIEDINDHQPEFPDKQVNIQFSENDRKGTTISILNAVDRDIGVLNSKITYQLRKSKDEPFTLTVSKSLDGTSKIGIILEEGLDREVKDLYMLHVMAKDGGTPSKQSILNIQIYVSDVNDNAPVFSRDVYNISVKNDNQISSPVVALSARDLDVGKNGRVSYHFSSKTSDIAKSHFELNRGTGDIFLSKRFNSGQKQRYKLYVTATDEGSPPLSSIAIVQINVVDQQNNAPSIDVNFVSASTGDTVAIFEDIEVGSFIAYVKVTDYDMGPNGEVSCNMHHDKFQLEMLGPKEYKIIIKNPVDRETEDYHRLMINCQDKGSPPLHSESQFSIKVMDVNDVQPQFSREIFKFFMYENEKSKSQVGAINATDPDLGPAGKLTFSLLANNKNFLPFQIMDNGVILSIVSLDHEFQDIYKFQVFVKDGGTPSLNNTVNVIVEVKDKNDNAPYFTYPSVNPCALDFTYYPHHTKNVTVVKASDRDSRENAFLKYEIIAGNENQLLTLNHYTGLLSFTRVVNPQDAGLYDLQFLVRDSGTPSLSSTTTLALTLTVSNETSEIVNGVHSQSGDKIHLYLLILVVLVAVTVSVPVTAAMSLCIIRCKDRKNALNRDGESISCKCVSEQGRLICPSHMASYWPDTSGFMAPDSDMASNSLPANTKRDDSCNGQKGSVLGMRSQKSTEVIYEEIPEIPLNKNIEERTLMIPKAPWDTVTYHTDSGDAWSEVEYTPVRKKQDLFRTRSSQSYSSLTSRNKIQPTRLKPILKKPSVPKENNSRSSSLDELIAGPIPHCQGWATARRPAPNRDYLPYRNRPRQQLSTLPKTKTDYIRQRTHPQNSVPAPVTKFLVKIIDSKNPLQTPYVQKSVQHRV